MTNEQRTRVDAAHESLHLFLEKKSQNEEDYNLGRVLGGAALHVLKDHDCEVGIIIAAIAEHLDPEAITSREGNASTSVKN